MAPLTVPGVKYELIGYLVNLDSVLDGHFVRKDHWAFVEGDPAAFGIAGSAFVAEDVARGADAVVTHARYKAMRRDLPADLLYEDVPMRRFISEGRPDVIEGPFNREPASGED